MLKLQGHVFHSQDKIIHTRELWATNLPIEKEDSTPKARKFECHRVFRKDVDVR